MLTKRRVLLASGVALCVSAYTLLRTKRPDFYITPSYQFNYVGRYDQNPNQHFLTKEPRTIGIIGAGPAGIIAAKTLHQHGFQVEVLEKQSGPGGVWHENYDKAGLQTPGILFSIPDFPFPSEYEFAPELSSVRKFSISA